MTITPEQLAMMREDAAAARTNAEAARSLDESDAMAFACVGAEVVAGHVERLCAEVERLRAALAVAERAASLCAGEVATLRRAAAPTRGDLSVAYNSACARRVEAEEALRRRPVGAGSEEAQRRLVDALADEAAKRAALDAFEREHGLDLTHPDPTEEPAR